MLNGKEPKEEARNDWVSAVEQIPAPELLWVDAAGGASNVAPQRPDREISQSQSEANPLFQTIIIASVHPFVVCAIYTIIAGHRSRTNRSTQHPPARGRARPRCNPRTHARTLSRVCPPARPTRARERVGGGGSMQYCPLLTSPHMSTAHHTTGASALRTEWTVPTRMPPHTGLAVREPASCSAYPRMPRPKPM